MLSRRSAMDFTVVSICTFIWNERLADIMFAISSTALTFAA